MRNARPWLVIAFFAAQVLSADVDAQYSDIVRRNVAAEEKLAWQQPQGVRKMAEGDAGEKFWPHFWDFGEELNISIALPPFARHAEHDNSWSALWARELSRRGGTCPSGTNACTSIDQPNSCCPSGDTCISVQDTGNGPVGCCPNGQTCGNTIGSCAAGFTSCPDSDNKGCCIPGFACAGSICVNAATHTLTPTTSTTTTSSTTSTAGVSILTIISIDTSGVTVTATVTTTVTASQQPTSSSVSAVAPVRPTTSNATVIVVASATASSTTSLTTTTTTLATGLCPTGYYMCSAIYLGGCCQVDRDCNTTSCPTTASTTVLSGSPTVVAPAGATANNPCANNWYSCAASLGGNCCPSGYNCGTASCIAGASGVADQAKQSPSAATALTLTVSFLVIAIVAGVDIALTHKESLRHLTTSERPATHPPKEQTPASSRLQQAIHPRSTRDSLLDPYEGQRRCLPQEQRHRNHQALDGRLVELPLKATITLPIMADSSDKGNDKPKTNKPLNSAIIYFQPSAKLIRFAKKYRTEIAASSSSVFSTFIAFPLDFVKSRMQSYDSTLTATIKDAYKAEGIRGCWRGSLPPLVSVTVVRTISFSLYQRAKYVIDGQVHKNFGVSPLAMANAPNGYPNHYTLSCFGLAGACSGIAITAISCPFELTKLNEQLAGKIVRDAKEAREAAIRGGARTVPPVYDKKFGAIATARRLMKQRGIAGLYSGYQLHLLRDTIGTAIYFMSYESVKQLLANARGNEPTSPHAVFIAGGLCGIISWACIYPVDVAKTVYQKALLASETGRATRPKIKFFEFRAYRGLGVSVIRSSLINMIFFSMFEFTKKRINALDEPEEV